MRVSRENVAYLALEGGGGKGVAYLGAIRALETIKILPIDINQPGKNRVLGISGPRDFNLANENICASRQAWPLATVFIRGAQARRPVKT